MYKESPNLQPDGVDLRLVSSRKTLNPELLTELSNDVDARKPRKATPLNRVTEIADAYATVAGGISAVPFVVFSSRRR